MASVARIIWSLSEHGHFALPSTSGYGIVAFSFCDLPSLPFTLTVASPGPLAVGKTRDVIVTTPLALVVPVETAPPGHVTATEAPAIGTGGGGLRHTTVTVTESVC